MTAERAVVVPPSKPILDVVGIQKLIPHRSPFLLVDRVVSFEPGAKIVAWKSVTMNEPFFVGHFPGKPVMPGVLILEALAQAGVGGDVEAGGRVAGSPATPGVQWARNSAVFNRLTEMRRELRDLRADVARLRAEKEKKEQ